MKSETEIDKKKLHVAEHSGPQMLNKTTRLQENVGAINRHGRQRSVILVLRNVSVCAADEM